MTDFTKLKAHCTVHSKKSSRVNDNFLMDFLAPKDQMSKNIDRALRRYKHIVEQMPRDFFPTVSAEYIIGKGVVKDGLINKYMDHPHIRRLDPEDREFLEFQQQNPWRYVFGRIADRPEREFFVLRDEFRDDEYLLYSPSMEAYCKAGHEHSLYFLLLGFNGACWQTYGLIAPYRSFDAGDVFVYGTEVFPEIEDDESFMDAVHRDPMPFFMLSVGQELPIVMNGEDEIRHYVSETEIPEFDSNKLSPNFTVQWNENVYRLSIKKWSQFPHYASAYYNEETDELCRYALTKRAFDSLSRKLIDCGLDLTPQEDYSLGLSMQQTIEKILKRKIRVNDYEAYFPEMPESTAQDVHIEQMNAFLNELIPYINSGKTPDIPALANAYSIDVESAKSIYKNLKDKFSK
ncbi:MAG: hypothetical protein H6606_11190 [Flavobacteriales bacterium]|nr:hypothetical protein [Flavobacteriales bacterium]